MLTRAVALLALAASALASISITNPIASTSLAGGKSLKISWLADSDTVTPLAKSFGNSSVSIYTGSSSVQYPLELFGYLDPAKTTSISKVIPKTLGPSAALYFIRIESLSAKDSAGNPLEAFSARFTLTGMTGSWTTEQAAANSAISPAASTVATTSAMAKASSTRSATKAAANANAASSTTTVVAIVTASANASQNTATSGAAAAQGLASLGIKVAAGLAGVAGAMMLL